MGVSPLKEYYLWRKDVETTFPWERQFLNYEFLKHERIRITKLFEWRKTFLKNNENKNLEEVSFYTVPLELSSSWRASIASLRDFNYIGLSALQNSPQVLIIALLPYAIKQPAEYKLINIIKSKRGSIINKRDVSIEPVVIIDEWEYLPSDKIYADIPYEKKVIQKIFQENLIHDDHISLSFQSPIISAPYVEGKIGGISLSSLAGDSSFAKELVKTIQFMVPPEYRGLNPPEKAYLGSKFEYFRGIKFHPAERPYFDNNFLSSVYDMNYSGVSKELLKRSSFGGEYSIFSTINPTYGNIAQVWKELMRNFTATEIALPQDLDEFPAMDVDLTKLKKEINEDLWIQVVHSRQIKPSTNKEADDYFIKIIELVKKDFDVLLTDIYKHETDREHLIRTTILHPIQYNLRRLAQSFARANDRNNVFSDDLSAARNLIVDNFKEFIMHPEFERIRVIMEEKRNNAKYSVVQTEIMNNPRSSTGEIWNSLESTGLFKNIYDLQKLLDWLHEKGYVIVDRDKKYLWVG